jgi:hypothetical protein
MSGSSRAMVKSLKVDQPVILVGLVSRLCVRTMTGEVSGEASGDGPADFGEEVLLSPMRNKVNEGGARGPPSAEQPGTRESIGSSFRSPDGDAAIDGLGRHRRGS